MGPENRASQLSTIEAVPGFPPLSPDPLEAPLAEHPTTLLS